MARPPDTSEFKRIRRLIRAADAPGAGDGDGVRVGPGDDAAILRAEPDRDLAVTTDAFVDGRHWLDAWIDGRTLGIRLARANLSDLAAMASRPRWATFAMGLRADRDPAWSEAVEAGVAAALAADGARIVGGNLSAAAGQDWLCLTLIGEGVPGGAWLRSGARPGDRIAVTGWPGRAGAAMALIAALGDGARAPEWAALLAGWREPASRVDLARALAASQAVTAAIDISDGFGGDLSQLCEASGVGAAIEREAWPADAPLEAAARRLGVDPFALRAGPSDDYELLLALDPARAEIAARIAREAGVPWTLVGNFTAAPGVIEWVEADRRRSPFAAAGYDHFA